MYISNNVTKHNESFNLRNLNNVGFVCLRDSFLLSKFEMNYHGNNSNIYCLINF